MQLREITEPLLRSINVRTILPQREPFVMIDTLVRFEMMSSTTELLIRPTNIFVDDGAFSPFGMMENIAQSCAARIGFYNKYILHKDVQVGYIGAIRDYQIRRLPPAGSTISTTVDVEEEIFGMTLASARILCNDEPIVTATIKLAVKNIQ